MAKEKFELEFVVRSAPKVLYNRLATPGGLSEWFADNVNIKGDRFFFIWDGAEEEAILLNKNAGESIESRQNKDESSEVKGQIDIIVQRHDTFLEVSVVDNGIGLPKDRSRLFEPYITTREKGTGLGLAIVKHIVNQHRGEIDISSEEGNGTQISLNFPKN